MHIAIIETVAKAKDTGSIFPGFQALHVATPIAILLSMAQRRPFRLVWASMRKRGAAYVIFVLGLEVVHRIKVRPIRWGMFLSILASIACSSPSSAEKRQSISTL